MPDFYIKFHSKFINFIFSPFFSSISATLTLIAYNPSKSPSTPATHNAFIAGTYLDNSTVYVGAGRANSCRRQMLIPARLSTATTDRGPGAYIECNGPAFDDKRAAFLPSNPNLRWIPTTTESVTKVVGAVVIKTGDFGFYIGRINLTSSSGFKYQQVSKIHIDNGHSSFWYVSEMGEQKNADDGYEVLTCKI
jgi:hypothetical protein